jgi:hypothetical protein
MQMLKDIATSIYNFKKIGRELSKRPGGMVAGSFLVLTVIYVLIYGLWYSDITGDFITETLEASKPYLPSFTIQNGRLMNLSPEPYILTHEEIYQIIAQAVIEVDKKRFEGKNAEQLMQGFEAGQINQKDTFCLVMDTTGTYKDKVNLDNYTRYAVVTADTAEYVDRIQNMPGKKTPLSESVKQDIRFTPDLVENLKGPATRITAISIVISMFIYTPLRFLLKALIAALIVWAILSIAKKEITFGTLYKIALYSLAPVVVLAVISRFTIIFPGLIYQALYFAAIVVAGLAAIKPKEEGSLQQQT